jgi:hypothetical protein
MEQESKVQAHADRRKFIRHNVLMTDLKTLATQFIARFDLQSKSAAYDALLASLNQEGFTEQAAEVKVCRYPHDCRKSLYFYSKDMIANMICYVLKTKEFKTWLTTALAEDRSTLQTVVNRQQTKLEVAGVLKGSHLIRSGMNRLVPTVRALLLSCFRYTLIMSRMELTDRLNNHSSSGNLLRSSNCWDGILAR